MENDDRLHKASQENRRLRILLQDRKQNMSCLLRAMAIEQENEMIRKELGIESPRSDGDE